MTNEEKNKADAKKVAEQRAKRRKQVVDQKSIAVFAVGQARRLQNNEELPEELRDLPLDILANIMAFAIDRVINDNVFQLYIAERKIK